MNTYIIQTARGDVTVRSDTAPRMQLEYTVGGFFLEVGEVAKFRAPEVLGWYQVPVDPVPSHE